MGKNWMELLGGQNQIQKIMDSNDYINQFGLQITQQDAALIVAGRTNALKEQRRIEFGEGIVPKLIYAFCDSAYVDQDNYVDTLVRLQDIFYLFKNEMQDEITDDELIHFMKECFENICYGDSDYLAGTCLENFAQAIRMGYREYRQTDGYGVYGKLDEVPRWDYELYAKALGELF